MNDYLGYDEYEWDSTYFTEYTPFPPRFESKQGEFKLDDYLDTMLFIKNLKEK